MATEMLKSRRELLFLALLSSLRKKEKCFKNKTAAMLFMKTPKYLSCNYDYYCIMHLFLSVPLIGKVMSEN